VGWGMGLGIGVGGARYVYGEFGYKG